MISRALAAGHRPRSALLQQKWLDDLAPLLADHDIPVYLAEPEMLETITGFVMYPHKPRVCGDFVSIETSGATP